MTVNDDSGGSNETRRRRVDWSDPEVPAGNSPPLPAWPLVIAGVLWGACVVFLAVMVLGR